MIDRARAARRLRLTLLLIFSSVQFAQTASAQSVATDTPQPVAERGPLSVGFYAGELYKSEYISILYRPQDIQLSPSYLVAANVDYRIYKSADIPIQFEGEFDIAKRFHGADEFDVVLAPFVRWTWFPWNRFLYTNVRVGALGLSYTSGVSTWERQNSGNNRGSKFLQIGAMEVPGLGLHRIWWVGGRYAYASALLDGFTDHILMVIDMADPTKPQEVGRWWLPGMNAAAGETPTWKNRVRTTPGAVTR